SRRPLGGPPDRGRVSTRPRMRVDSTWGSGHDPTPYTDRLNLGVGSRPDPVYGSTQLGGRVTTRPRIRIDSTWGSGRDPAPYTDRLNLGVGSRPDPVCASTQLCGRRRLSATAQMNNPV